MLTIETMNFHLAHRAITAKEINDRVLFWHNKFWRVVHVEGIGTPKSPAWRLHLQFAFSARTLDDCSPVEWDLAARAARQTC